MAARDDMATPKPRPNIEVGFGDFLPFTEPYRGSHLIHKYPEVTIQQLVRMRQTDGQARALYRLITLPIRAALKSATFVPAQIEEGGEEEANFIEQLFTLPPNAGGMTVPFTRIIAQMLQAVFDGFAPFEMVYQQPAKGPLKGKWTLEKLNYLPADTVKFLVTEKGSFDGFRQVTQKPNGRILDVKIPREASVYYAAQEEENKFYGLSYFQAAFYHYDKKVKLYYLMHLAGQRSAVGTRVGTVPEDHDVNELNAFRQGLSDLGVAQWMTKPENYLVELLKEGGSFDFLSYINHHNSQMSKSILAAFFDENQGTGGDASLVDFGKQTDSLFVMMLQTIMDEIASIINHYIIPRFVDWNFNSGKYPEFRWGPFTDDDKDAIQDVFTSLAGIQGGNFTREFFRETEKKMADKFGLEIDYETLEREEEEAAQTEAIDSGGELSPEGIPSPENTIPTEFLPEGFTLANVHEMGMVVALAYGDKIEDDKMVLELAGGRKVLTQEGVRRYGLPIGTPLGQAPKQGNARVKKDQNPQNNPAQGTIHKSSDPRVSQGGAAKPGEQQSGGAAVQRILAHPKLKNAKVLVYGDGTVQIQFPDGTKTARLAFDWKEFEAKGWKATVAKGKEDK
jgi:hypothetical protein